MNMLTNALKTFVGFFILLAILSSIVVLGMLADTYSPLATLKLSTGPTIFIHLGNGFLHIFYLFFIIVLSWICYDVLDHHINNFNFLKKLRNSFLRIQYHRNKDGSWRKSLSSLNVLNFRRKKMVERYVEGLLPGQNLDTNLFFCGVTEGKKILLYDITYAGNRQLNVPQLIKQGQFSELNNSFFRRVDYSFMYPYAKKQKYELKKNRCRNENSIEEDIKFISERNKIIHDLKNQNEKEWTELSEPT